MNRKFRRAQAKAAPTTRPPAVPHLQGMMEEGFRRYQGGQLAEAEQFFRQVLAVDPRHADALHLLGIIAYQVGQNERAIEIIGKAIEIKPTVAAYHSNQGSALQELGRLDQAVAAFDTALRLKPDYATAYYNKGNALKELGRLEDAVVALNTALRLKPDYEEARSNLMICLHYQAGNNEDSILKEAQRFVAHIQPKPRTSFMNAAEPRRRLRIGYVSADLRRHPVGYFLSAVLPNHDPDAVEVYCYSNSRDTDDMTAKLHRAAHHWRSIVGLSDAEAAARVIADEIDILVDLSGHTEGTRLLMFAGRAAPVQVTWLGFWGTTGVPAMDYILSDETTIQPGQERLYSERVFRLPGSRFATRRRITRRSRPLLPPWPAAA